MEKYQQRRIAITETAAVFGFGLMKLDYQIVNGWKNGAKKRLSVFNIFVIFLKGLRSVLISERIAQLDELSLFSLGKRSPAS